MSPRPGETKLTGYKKDLLLTYPGQ
jgi:hypothetical protein